MEAKTTIFLVEDDESFGSVLKSYLEINNFQVHWQKDGLKAIKDFKKEGYDICILDIMLPGADGYTIAQNIKAQAPNVPIIFLTAKTLKEDIIKGYKTGVDDYITKPFDSELLLYKIRAILNRKGQAANEEQIQRVGIYEYNSDLRTLQYNNTFVKLSPKEAALLRLLLRHKNQILPREEALLQIWGENDYFTTRSMDVYLSKIRKYLKADPNLAIENIHGSGFILRTKEE